MHRQIDGAAIEAAIDDIAAVARHGGANPRLDQLADLGDDVGIGGIVREIFRHCDIGGAAGPEQGGVADEVIEQHAQHLRLQLRPVGSRGGSDRNEVSAEEDAFDIAQIEQRLRQRGSLGLFRSSEITRSAFHHRLSGQEFQGRRVGRMFGFDQHEGHLGRMARRIK